jgi:hypothetical protein
MTTMNSNKKISVSAEDVRSAARFAQEKLQTMQRDIGSLLIGLNSVARDDANFATRDSINNLLAGIEASSPREVLRSLAKVHNARLLARAKEG